jgi:hypothetical protein
LNDSGRQIAQIGHRRLPESVTEQVIDQASRAILRAGQATIALERVELLP